MKFFIPAATDDANSQTVLDGIIRFMEEQHRRPIIREFRGYQLAFRHNGVNQVATVGERFARTGEPVIAILKSVTYLICTPNQGVLRGEPYMVGYDEVQSVVEFEK